MQCFILILFFHFFISFRVDKSLLWEEKVNHSYSMLLYSSTAASLFTSHHERQLYIGPRKSLGSWDNGPRVNVTYLFIVMTSSDKMEAVWSWISHNINEKNKWNFKIKISSSSSDSAPSPYNTAAPSQREGFLLSLLEASLKELPGSAGGASSPVRVRRRQSSE